MNLLAVNFYLGIFLTLIMIAAYLLVRALAKNEEYDSFIKQTSQLDAYHKWRQEYRKRKRGE